MFIIYYHLGFRVLDILDSMDSTCISTLCLSSLLSKASYRRTRLRGNPKSSKFTSRSYTRPRQSPQRVAREPSGNPQKLQLYLAFGRSTTPIHAKGCTGTLWDPQSSNFTSRSRARPRQSTQRVARGAYMLSKSGNFTSRSRVRAFDHANPRKELLAAPIKVATLPRVRALDHANPWKALCVMPKSCNFTSRSRARPRQSMERVAFPIDGVGAGSRSRKKDRYTEM